MSIELQVIMISHLTTPQFYTFSLDVVFADSFGGSLSTLLIAIINVWKTVRTT